MMAVFLLAACDGINQLGHTYPRAGRATYLVVPEIEDPKTVNQVADERVGQFQVRLVIPRAGTEVYLMKDKADRNAQLFDRSDFSARVRAFKPAAEPSTN